MLLVKLNNGKLILGTPKQVSELQKKGLVMYVISDMRNDFYGKIVILS